MPDTRPDLDRIVLLNFGGIGDEILFSPVIHAIRRACPDAHLTLILEARSGRIRELLPQLDRVIEVEFSRHGRVWLFWRLWRLLFGRHYDAVISSGSSPFIPVLLWMSRIPLRVGFETGKLSRKLLTAAALLDRKTYAGEMYFSLARTFLQVIGALVPNDNPAMPRLEVSDEARARALQILLEVEPSPPRQRILIHPGVSRISVQKRILKAWPVDRWKSLLAELPVRYPEANVYLLGGPDDAEVLSNLDAACQNLPESCRSRIFNLYGKSTSLRDLAGLIAIGDLLISVDSAPMHLAVGLQTPTVAIFAPTDEKKLLPQTDKAVAVARNDLSCRPCLWDVRQTSCENPVCLEVSVDRVLEKVDALLAGVAPDTTV